MPQRLALQFLSHQAVVRHGNAATLSESLVAAAAVLCQPVGDFIPWLIQRAGGTDRKEQPHKQPIDQQQLSAAAVLQDASEGGNREEQQDTWWSSALSEEEEEEEELQQQQQELEARAAPEPTLPVMATAAPALAPVGGVLPIWRLLLPAAELKQRAELLRQVFNTTQARLAAVLRSYPVLLKWDPLTLSIKVVALSSIIMGRDTPPKEAAQQLAQWFTRCPQVLLIDTQRVANRAKLLQERLRLSLQQLQALLLKQPQLLLLREERLAASLDQLQQLLPQGDGQQLRKAVLQRPVVGCACCCTLG